MATTVLSISTLANWATRKYLEGKQIPEARRDIAFRIAKYNTLATGYNLGTILMVVAAAALVFASLHFAIAMALIGAAISWGAGKELGTYAQPEEGDHMAVLRHIFHVVAGRGHGDTAHIFHKIGIPAIPNWNPNRLMCERIVLFKNTIPLDAGA